MANNVIVAKKLSAIELKMLDTGAPVIVACKTLNGESVSVRLQTAILEGAEPEKGSWLAHGAYIAVMPNGAQE
ncbi:hypothetical protein NC77_21005 [Janthinobacterium lividum]|uniref:hypothetical protein n=1 Tax=Janthinobacterium lividum TaxID=29581 RepID=UPI0005382FD7|nr:hypothetical protein [Janthinobacterium lividum]KHA76952.1 hypothetical protein NC77_21005 [Janthinobacterium lividum]